MKTIKIGRDFDNDIRLVDGTVSGHHAIITFDGVNYTIQDVGSKNGTYVNGNRISAERCVGYKQLDKYDVVKIGFQPLPWLSYFESDSDNYTKQMPADKTLLQPTPTVTDTENDSGIDIGTGSSVKDESNAMATIGFVCSFFIPLLGMVFSIIGLNKSGTLNGKGHDLAVTGIIISIIGFLIELIIISN